MFELALAEHLLSTYKDDETYFKYNIAKGREFMFYREYYGFMVKMNGKSYRYNHDFKLIKKQK